jgi:outer membrane lipoprotein-sorting protein
MKAHLRSLAFAFGLAALPAAPALAQGVTQELPLSVLSGYINALQSAETDFVQTNADGTTATGRLVIKRPYRMRFEYAPPDRTLVLASAATVAVFDPKSNEPPAQYPLNRTPLNLILGSRVDLTRAQMVVDHGVEDGFTTVTAQDPDHPDYGTIKLFFSANPVALRAWTVTDDTGNVTHVELGPLRTGIDYPSQLFDIAAETARRAGD